VVNYGDDEPNEATTYRIYSIWIPLFFAKTTSHCISFVFHERQGVGIRIRMRMRMRLVAGFVGNSNLFVRKLKCYESA